MDVDIPQIDQKAQNFCKEGNHMQLLKRIYSGLIKVNAKAHSLAISKLCEEIEPDVDDNISDSSISEDSVKMLTYDEQMEVDYPFLELVNPEYEYTYVP